MAGDRTPIDFPRLAAALLDRAQTLVQQWLPDGHREGHEWKARNPTRSDERIGSFSVNLTTGFWADFADDDAKGRDLISLYAYLQGLNNGQAALTLMAQLGWQAPQTPARAAPERAAGPSERPEPPPEDADAPASGGARAASSWRPIVPVPTGAPPPTFKHWHYSDPEAVWEYRFEGALYGHVVRFRKSDGGKEIFPHTWCEDVSDSRGTQRWHWHQWAEPRPLYVPATVLSGDGALPVVLVEGEKCAKAGLDLLGHEFDFVSWPGGANAWAKADWSWLKGRAVVLWPDCDAKRAKLSRAEREAGMDPLTKPLLPEGRQPGVRAMVQIGSLLVAEHNCSVTMCPLPAPGDVADGWDLADAIAQGWGVEQVRGFIRGARTFVPPDDAARAKGASTPSSAGAGGDDPETHAWRAKLLTTEKGATKACRENVVLALDGLDLGDGSVLPGIPEARGVIAFNEFTNDVMKLQAAPWGSPAGVWDEVDELLMGEWLTRQHWLPSMPRGTLEEAVRMVAYRQRYHPVREYLRGLVWDRVPRLATWLQRAVLDEDEHDPRAPLQRYLARVGTWFLQGMCARALTPGVKFDYMLILEGKQGLRKSTLLATLAGEYFADTGLVLGEKDSYQQLQGRWLYEFPELDAFSKADVTKIKAFIASVSDYFRASFDKRARDYPRQLVFGGSTNEDHYLTDPTGNRRFWPVRVTRKIDIDWVREHRDQLFAEAVQRVRDGARMYPTPEEETELFEPQQQQRSVENAIESAICRWLSDNADGQICNEISLVELLGKIGIGIEKLGPGRFHEKQAAAALRRLGWAEGRSSRPGRPRVYRRPDEMPRAPRAAGDVQPTEDSDAPPF